MSKASFVSPYKLITDRILADLEAGVAPWAKPWKVDSKGQKVSLSSGFPVNFSSRKQYRGINVFLLLTAAQANGFKSNAWATFKQISAMKGTVKKGSKSQHVFFMSKVEKEPTGAEGERINDNGKVEIFILKGYSVFNLEQCEGIELEQGALEIASSLPEDVADFIAMLSLDLRTGGDQAFYSPSGDFVAMPKIEAFKDGDNYRATLYHETGHWTGAASRLNREFGKRFGDQAYAFEELVAELSAAFLAMEFGIEARLQHSEYIGNWIKVLKNDERAFYTAASHAQKVLDFIREKAAGQTSAEEDDMREAA
ncbi:ArdC family protein [Rhizobium ruizarguesonis]